MMEGLVKFIKVKCFASSCIGRAKDKFALSADFIDGLRNGMRGCTVHVELVAGDVVIFVW